MKNINAAITAAELSAVQIPRHQFILEDSLIRFSEKNTSLSNASINTRIPITIETLSSSSNHAWAVFNTSSTRVRYIRVNESSDLNLPDLDSTIIAAGAYCQRPGLLNDGTDVYLFYPEVNTGSGYFQIKRVSLTSQTSNPVSLSGAVNFGPQVPFAYSYDNSNLDENLNHFNTIRAVMPVAGGVIVLTGDHNLGQKKIFCNFYYVTASGYEKLSTNFVGDIDEPLSAVSDAPMYSHACAYEDNGSIYVFFNTNQAERTAYFKITNGLESEVKLVVPIDREDDTQNFYCNSITKLNNLYVMTGRFSFKNSDDTYTGFDTYLTSSDLENWSIGETNSFICSREARGKIVYSNNYLYYLGNLFWAKATPNKELAPLSSAIFSSDITSRVSRFSTNQSLDSADSLSLAVSNSDLYFNSGSPLEANTIRAISGQGATLSTIGVFSIDSTSQPYSVEGIQLREIQCRDVGMKKLNDWQSPIDMWLEGSYQYRSDMTSPDGLIIKSENVDSFGTFTKGDNFKYTGLNVPYMMLFDGPYSESSIIKASVRMTDYDDPYHLSSFGFMLGAHQDDDDNFNSLMLLIPRERGGPTPYTTLPTLRKLNLVEVDATDPDKVDTGLKYEQYVSSLWRQAGDETPITTSTNATYEHVSNFRIPKDVQTDLMVRLNGRYIELYSKPRVRSVASWAQNAEWLLKTVVSTPDNEALYPEKNSYAGIAVSTDVSASKDWFAQGKYGDMVLQLSYASDYHTEGTQGQWTRLFATGTRSGGTEDSYVIASLGDPGELDHFAVGMKVLLHGISYFTGWYLATIEEIYPTGIRIDIPLGPAYVQTGTNATWVPTPDSDYRTPSEYPGGIPPAEGSWVSQGVYQTVNNYEIQIYGLGQQPWFGEVSSQAKATPVNNSSSYMTVETGATKKGTLIEGRGVLVTSDSTAMSIRHFDSDGVIHRLKSGNTNAGGTYTAFDETSPLVNTNRWKFIMYHGKFFDGTPESNGCKPGNGYVIVEDEIIRYVNYSSLQRGYYPNDSPQYNNVTICPAAYMPVQDASLGASFIYNWKSWGGALPGDQFDELATKFGVSPVGMLVEVLSKNVSKDNTEDGDSGYYIKTVVPSSPSSTAGVELSTPLKTRLVGPVTNIDNPSDPYWSVPANKNQAPEGDMVVVNGRAQFGTKKQKHNETAAVRYYPCNSQGQSPYIKISSSEYYQGGARTTEDMIKNICAMAGVRNVKARSAFDDASAVAPLTYTLTSTPVSLPLQEQMEDFTLEGSFYIPGNNITSGAVSNRNELRVYFRNKYYIAIEQYVTASDYDAGYKGTIYIRLATTDTSINAFNSERTLESIKVRNKTSFSGNYSGASPVTNATLTPDLQRKTKVKISVSKKFISVEINDKPMISFCIDEYILEAGGSLAFYGAGPIQLSYASNIAGNSCQVRVFGIGDPISGYAIRKDSTAKSALDEIVKDRHIFTRTTEDGGVEFGQFWNRDYFGNLHTFIVSDQEQASKEQVVGHIAYKSDKIISNWIDEDWVIQNGYKYLAGSGVSVENSYYALREAKLSIRKQKEESFTRDIEALPRLALQPEDEVDISHPNLPSGRYIINSISLTAEDSSSLRASYSVRKKAV